MSLADTETGRFGLREHTRYLEGVSTFRMLHG